MTTGPRCLHPMRLYDLSRRSRVSFDAVCWRPAGHPGNKHQTKDAYERELRVKARDRGRWPRHRSRRNNRAG